MSSFDSEEICPVRTKSVDNCIVDFSLGNGIELVFIKKNSSRTVT